LTSVDKLWAGAIMTFSLHQAESVATQYAAKKQIQLAERLGFGMDGAVWKSTRNSAIKVLERKETYLRERDCYRRLLEDEVTTLAGFVVPYLIDYDNILQVVEMSIVAPPCVLDFGKAYLDDPPDFSEETLATLWAERAAAYEPHQWPLVRKVLAALRGHGIHYFDPQPGNIRFPPEKGP